MIRGSLKNPVARIMFTIGIILVGMIAFADLAIDLFPDISLPIITIQTDYEGASPQDIEITITRPIEKRLSRIQNVRYVSSRSRKGPRTSPLNSTGGRISMLLRMTFNRPSARS
jgi:HAE1 family hydrophobic/amphiphilic exporter-1